MKRVADLEERLSALEGRVDGARSGFASDPRLADPSEPGAHVRELAMAGHKIEAIKAYREQTGAGLKEAKDAVEELAG